MQKSLFTSLFMYTHRRILEPCILKSITSFSANPIKVIGQFTCLVSFTISGPKVPITITVISDILGVPNMLLGNDSLRATWAVLAFAGDKNDPQPELIVRNPIDQKVVVYYEPPRNIFTCVALVALKPFETKSVEFDLNHAARPLYVTLKSSSIVLIGVKSKFILQNLICILIIKKINSSPQVWL